MHPTQFLQDHSCSSFYCGLPRQIDPEYTGFVLCKRNMVSWLFQIVIIGWYWFYWWGCIIHILAYIVQPSAGSDLENSEGVGEGGGGRGGVRGTCQLYRYYLFYWVFFKYSAKFHRKRGGHGSFSQSLPPVKPWCRCGRGYMYFLRGGWPLVEILNHF